MKTKQICPQRLPAMACRGLLMMLFLLAMLSCKKNNQPPDSTGLQNIVAKLDGEILYGSLSTQTDENGLLLWCNGGKILIGMAKIPLQAFTNPGKIEHAEVLYSNFGIIIRNTETNKRWYYIQNDEKSRQQFDALLHTGEKPVVSGITGTIRLNIS
ncbi:MAG: hypothetical protein ABIX01_01310 [Chitinophagaceae bacterium]